MAESSPGARGGIYSLAFDDFGGDNAEDSAGLRSRLSPVHHSREQSRRPATVAQREEDRERGLLSGSAAFAAAVQVAAPQTGRLSQFGTGGSRGSFPSDVSRAAHRPTRARC